MALPPQASDTRLYAVYLYAMPPHQEEDTTGSLERAREALYSPSARVREEGRFTGIEEYTTPHAWEEREVVAPSHQGERHLRLATLFLGGAAVFFLLALAGAGFFFFFGSNSVSIDKISVDLQGPTTIAGGDTVPLSITITNRNPAAVENATIEVDFPESTRSATNVLAPYPRYVENLGTLESGATVHRSIKAVVFGGAGQTIYLPVSFSYGTASSNAVFEKKSSYPLAITSTPLSVSVDALSETVSGAPITFTLTVRSNATVPLSNVAVAASSPFGFSITSSSIPLANGGFLIGTLAPGTSKQVTLTGTLSGQNNEQRVFRFTVGTSKSSQDATLSVPYMSQDATVTISAPFITTSVAINGDTSSNVVITPGSTNTVALTYTNTLSTLVTNASIAVSVAGSAIDYDSIRTTNGFYNSGDHTIRFNRDTDPALAQLAPGASGIGTFTFSTLPVGTLSPTVTLSLVASGTRVGQTDVPEQVTTSVVKTARVATTVVVSSRASHINDPFGASGPVPPRANQATTYVVIWNVQNKGNAVAGGTVTATLPSYVSYTGKTSGTGAFSYDSVSRSVTWNIGDIAQGASAQGLFQLSFTPSTSQKGSTVSLTSTATLVGHDRFAGVSVGATADPATTETTGDAGYVPANGVVQ